MSKIDDIIVSLKNELMNEECVKQYFYYKNIIDENEELKALDSEIKFYQKEMCKNKENNEVYLKEKALYEDAKSRFDSNPILINYQIAKDEVFSLLVDIEQVLS